MNSKINILIISIYYPPILSIASNRIYSFTKYLDKNKFNIFVLTIDSSLPYYNEQANVKIYRIKNKALIKRANTNKKSFYLWHKAKAVYNILLNFIIKDEYHYWTKKAKKKGIEIIKDKKIDVILSSYAPVASHLIALNLKRKFKHIKWIADMRDEMSKNIFINKYYRNYLKKTEEKIFKNVNAITSVSMPILNDFIKLSDNNKIIFKEITNGYDFELDNNYKKNTTFNISYFGSFYGKRNPILFLNAIEELYKAKEIIDFEIKFIGSNNLYNISKTIKNKIIITDKINHSKAIEKMKQSDLLLLIHPKTKRKGVYTGKLFEYLASLKPILALIDKNDVAAELINSCNAGYIADNDNLTEIKEQILLAYNDWKNNKEYKPNLKIIKKYHRKEQAKKMEELIYNLTSKN